MRSKRSLLVNRLMPAFRRRWAQGKSNTRVLLRWHEVMTRQCGYGRPLKD